MSWESLKPPKGFYTYNTYEKPSKFTLSDGEPDRLGKFINDNFYFECGYLQLQVSRYPHNPNITSCEPYLYFPEFELYYNKELSFEKGVESACHNYVGISDLQQKISNAVNNEILYRLIKEHGANYQSALDFTFLLTEPAARYEPFDEGRTFIRIREKTSRDKGFSEYFSGILRELLNRAKLVCKRFRIEHFTYKYLPDPENGYWVVY